jgi:hypothetical protein
MLKSTLAAVAAVFSRFQPSLPQRWQRKRSHTFLLSTSAGNIELELKQPKGTGFPYKNFVNYVNSGFYNKHYLSPRDPRLYGTGRRFQTSRCSRRSPTRRLKNEADKRAA